MWLAQDRGPLTAGLRCLTAPRQVSPAVGWASLSLLLSHLPGCFSLISQTQRQLSAGGKGRGRRGRGEGGRQVLEEASQGHRKGFSWRESREELG